MTKICTAPLRHGSLKHKLTGWRTAAAAGALGLMLSALPAAAGTFSDALKAYQAKDYPRALAAFQQLAAGGNAAAMHNLAVMLEKGTGAERNIKAAITWYERAAEAGYQKSRISLAFAHMNRRDYTNARRWFQKAAEGGHGLSYFMLGYMAANGLGRARDDATANSWYLKAAQMGVPEAQNNLAMHLSLGRGTPRDAVGAYMWFTLALKQFNRTDPAKAKQARQGRETLAENMTTGQIARAQLRASRWKKTE